MTLLSGNKVYAGLPLAYPRQPDPSQSIGGTKLGRPFIVLRRHIRIFIGVLLKEVVPLHVGIKGFWINWVRLSQLCLLFRSQTHPDFVRNRLGYFIFDVKNVLRRIVVIL